MVSMLCGGMQLSHIWSHVKVISFSVAQLVNYQLMYCELPHLFNLCFTHLASQHTVLLIRCCSRLPRCTIKVCRGDDVMVCSSMQRYAEVCSSKLFSCPKAEALRSEVEETKQELRELGSSHALQMNVKGRAEDRFIKLQLTSSHINRYCLQGGAT